MEDGETQKKCLLLSREATDALGLQLCLWQPSLLGTWIMGKTELSFHCVTSVRQPSPSAPCSSYAVEMLIIGTSQSCCEDSVTQHMTALGIMPGTKPAIQRHLCFWRKPSTGSQVFWAPVPTICLSGMHSTVLLSRHPPHCQ